MVIVSNYPAKSFHWFHFGLVRLICLTAYKFPMGYLMPKFHSFIDV